MSDARTQSLAYPQLNAAQVDAYIVYQRTLLKSLLDSSGDDWAGRFAFAHAKALKASKLDLLEQKQIGVVAAAYCGRRSSAQAVEERLAQAKAALAKGQASPKDMGVIEKAPAELERLDDMSELAQVYGAKTLQLLAAKEAELIELHRSVAKAEGQGHVHSPAQTAKS